jgi:hypothetical protein
MMSKKIKVKLKEITSVKSDDLKWTEKRLKKLESISGGYDTDKGYIRIFKDMYINDGNHRYKMLLDNFGDDYEITVKQLPVTRKVHIRLMITLFLTFSILLLPISIVILYIIGNKKSKKKLNG